MAMTKRLWSLNALAVELDADRRTVANALKRVPADGEQAGHPAWFILTAIRAMWPAPDANGEILDPTQERARKDRALAIQTELRNDVSLGKLVSADDAVAAWTAMVVTARNHFLGLPSKLRMLVPREYQENVHGRAEDLVHNALNELADAIVNSGSDDDSRLQNRGKEGEADDGQHGSEDLEGRGRGHRQPRAERSSAANRRASAQPSDGPRTEAL
ncbi:hypothetical protein ACLBX9_12855 [Methylobacterium sp. A49B]